MIEMIRSAGTACSAPQLGQTTTNSEAGAFRSISATTVNIVPQRQRNFFTDLRMAVHRNARYATYRPKFKYRKIRQLICSRLRLSLRMVTGLEVGFSTFRERVSFNRDHRSTRRSGLLESSCSRTHEGGQPPSLDRRLFSDSVDGLTRHESAYFFPGEFQGELDKHGHLSGIAVIRELVTLLTVFNCCALHVGRFPSKKLSTSWFLSANGCCRSHLRYATAWPTTPAC